MPRQGNNPKRRIADLDRLNDHARGALADGVVYVGSAHHKKTPGDYGFQPPVNPRPSKSLCDDQRIILKGEAQALLRKGVQLGMFSDFAEGGQPKYVWYVDDAGEAFEAKIGLDGYHGYRLTDDMRAIVLKEWKRRCPAD
jgi:hypothetical protein